MYPLMPRISLIISTGVCNKTHSVQVNGLASRSPIIKLDCIQSRHTRYSADYKCQCRVWPLDKVLICACKLMWALMWTVTDVQITPKILWFSCVVRIEIAAGGFIRYSILFLFYCNVNFMKPNTLMYSLLPLDIYTYKMKSVSKLR